METRIFYFLFFASLMSWFLEGINLANLESKLKFKSIILQATLSIFQAGYIAGFIGHAVWKIRDNLFWILDKILDTLAPRPQS